MSLTGTIQANEILKGKINWLREIHGYSAYEIAVINGFRGSEEEWLETLQGLSAYEVAVVNGFKGTEEAWLATLKGDKGDKGEAGTSFKVLGYHESLAALIAAIPNPETGDVYGVGATHPYDIYIYNETDGWVNNGKLQGAKGEDGKPGKDGEPGAPGKDGEAGYTPVKGVDYFTEADKAELVQAVLAALPTAEEESV